MKIEKINVACPLRQEEHMRPLNRIARELSGDAFKVYVYLTNCRRNVSIIDQISIAIGMSYTQIKNAMKELMDYEYLTELPDKYTFKSYKEIGK